MLHSLKSSRRTEVYIGKYSLSSMSFEEDCPGEVCPGEARPSEVRPGEIRPR
jgi:hypothetical protein